MLINVVQKAQGLFQDFPYTVKPDETKQLALANPLFSWHATYVNNRRKKAVVLTHDASTLVVVLSDVNAQNRAQLEERFWQRLAELWSAFGLTPTDLAAYRKVAKPWEIGKTASRSQLGRLNEITQVLPNFWTGPQADDAEISRRLSDFMRGTPKPLFGSDIAGIMAPANLVWRPVPEKKAPAATVDLRLIWRQLQVLDQQQGALWESEDAKRLDQAAAKIRRLNQPLIAAFIASISDDYTAKTVDRYLKDLRFYLNEYLSYHLLTVVNEDAANIGEPLLHGTSLSQTKRLRSTMGKFYKFLAQQQLIDQATVTAAKDDMTASLESAEMGMDDMFW